MAQDSSDKTANNYTSTAPAASTKKPRGREVTTLHGKLDHKCPIAVDNLSDMQFVQLYEDLDVVIAKAKFPSAL